MDGKVDITDSMVERALNTSKDFLAHRDPSKSFIADGSGSKIGYLAQEVFEAALINNNIPYSGTSTDVDHIGGGRVYDFIVNGETVDVKAVLCNTGYNSLFVNKDRIDGGYSCDLYYAVKFRDDPINTDARTQAYVVGYATKEMLCASNTMSFSNGTTAYVIPFSELKDAFVQSKEVMCYE